MMAVFVSGARRIVPRRAAARSVLLAAALALASCVSRFELELPARHPAHPDSPSSGALRVPSPFDVEPPPEVAAEEQAGEGHDMHDMHGDRNPPAPEPTPPPPNHGAHEGGGR